MKRRTKIAALCAGALTLGTMAILLARRKSNPFEGRVALKISALKQSYQRLEPIECKVEIKNIGATPIKDFDAFRGGRGREPYTFIVKNSLGELLPATPYNAEYLRVADSGIWSGSGSLTLDLGAGETSVDTLSINKFVRMRGPLVAGAAEFSVQIERFGARSNIVRLKIRP